MLPPAQDDRALVQDFAVLGSLLFAVTFVAYAATIDWAGSIPRDGTTLAVGRDFLNRWMHGRAAVTADPGPPALRLALRTWHLPGPALIAPALVVWLVIRLRAASRPALARS